MGNGDRPDRQREEGSISADEILLPCSLTLRPATDYICFLCQCSPRCPIYIYKYKKCIHTYTHTFATSNTHQTFFLIYQRYCINATELKVSRGQKSSAGKATFYKCYNFSHESIWLYHIRVQSPVHDCSKPTTEILFALFWVHLI